MAGRGRPGSAPQTDKREAYARLIASGVSSLQACRMVGINPRTGKRWRHGRTITSSSGRRLHYPPVINAPAREISPRFLSEDERVAIADLHRRGRGVRAIARGGGPGPGDDQPGVTPQPRPGQQPVPAVCRAADGGRPPSPARARQAGRRCRAGRVRGAASAAPVEPGADLPRAARAVSRPTRPPPGARDHLPGALPARVEAAPGVAAAGVAHRTIPPPAAPTPERAPRPPGGHDDDRPATGRGQ